MICNLMYFLCDMLFKLRANSKMFYLHFVKISVFSLQKYHLDAIYTT